MPTQAERLAALEAERPFIKEKLVSIEDKVDKLLDAHNSQKGMARLAAVIWAGLLGLGGMLGGMVMGKHG